MRRGFRWMVGIAALLMVSGASIPTFAQSTGSPTIDYMSALNYNSTANVTTVTIKVSGLVPNTPTVQYDLFVNCIQPAGSLNVNQNYIPIPDTWYDGQTGTEVFSNVFLGTGDLAAGPLSIAGIQVSEVVNTTPQNSSPTWESVAGPSSEVPVTQLPFGQLPEVP